MHTLIQTSIFSALPGRKAESNGWIPYAAQCCVHNGESVDRKFRGHMKFESDGSVIAGCFNCGYKTAYTPGQQFSYKFKKLLQWIGIDDSEITRLVFESLREREYQLYIGAIAPPKEKAKVSFRTAELPAGAISFSGMAEFNLLANGNVKIPTRFLDAVHYVVERKINLKKYDFYWVDNKVNSLDKRVIVPFTWQGNIVGYSARAFADVLGPKYIMSKEEGYVFNIDKQEDDWQTVIVTEGVFDAMAIDCVAVLHNEISKRQIDIIENLNREVIVVPDNDKAGGKLIDTAIDLNWSVSFPTWFETCKDISQAVEKYGKLFVLRDILENIERSSLKIQLRRKY